MQKGWITSAFTHKKCANLPASVDRRSKPETLLGALWLSGLNQMACDKNWPIKKHIITMNAATAKWFWSEWENSWLLFGLHWWKSLTLCSCQERPDQNNECLMSGRHAEGSWFKKLVMFRILPRLKPDGAEKTHTVHFSLWQKSFR